MKKSLLFILATFLVATAQAAVGDTFIEGNFKFTVTSEENHEVSVSTENYEISGDLIIPSNATNSNNKNVYSVTSIADNAFYGCNGLKEVTIPNSVTSIGQSAFGYCSGLSSISIPNSVKSIGAKAFIHCQSLSSLILPNSIITIEDDTFYGCSGLTSITIPESVTSIGNAVFSDCSELTSVTIPNTVTSIGMYAFSKCNGLKSVTIPSSVSSIGISPFSQCINLLEINVDENSKHFKSIHGILYDYDITLLIQCPCTKTEVTIPETITSIGANAFNECKYLPNITLPSSLTKIGGSAFNRCDGLKTINIPKLVEDISDHAFGDCQNLLEINVEQGNRYYSSKDGVLYRGTLLIQCPCAKTEVSVFNSTRTIGSWAFANCRELKSVTLPSTLKTIGYYAFSGCGNITKINIPESVTSIISGAFSGTGLYSIALPNTITKIREGTFVGCRNLSNIAIPLSVTSIEPYAFMDCESLSSIAIPSSVTSIGSYILFYNDNLTSLTIHNSLTEIGMGAFACRNLSSIYYMADDPVTFDKNIFYESTYETATLYVPEVAVEKCRITQPWMYFKSIVAHDFSGVEEIANESDATLPVEVYNLNGVKIAESTDGLPVGIYIVRQGKSLKKIAVK